MGGQDVTPARCVPYVPLGHPDRASTCVTEAATSEEAPQRGTGMGMQHITVTSGQAATATSSHGRGSRMAGSTQFLRP